MWEDFVKPGAIVGLSPGAQKVFVLFLNRANRSSTHPLDMRRFYGFVRYAHAHHARTSGSALSVLLREHGFGSARAESLAAAYEHGRAVLCGPCPKVRHGKVYA